MAHQAIQDFVIAGGDAHFFCLVGGGTLLNQIAHELVKVRGLQFLRKILPLNGALEQPEGLLRRKLITRDVGQGGVVASSHRVGTKTRDQGYHHGHGHYHEQAAQQVTHSRFPATKQIEHIAFETPSVRKGLL